MAGDILVVDDDAHIRDVICFTLQNAGIAHRAVANGKAALDAIGASAPDLMILDVGMPEMDGFEVCRAVRRTSELPILFLTARDDEVDRIVGLELGGDDYVTKPFSPRELVARVKAILKRAQPVEKAACVTTWNELELDSERHLCRFAGTDVSLTASEFAILSTLMNRPEVVMSRAQIMSAVYGPSIHVAERTLDSHIRNIRKKLAAAGCEDGIETLHGVGLRLGTCGSA